jgi:four helix bundle protein
MIAKASCAEVRSQLYSALDVGHLDDEAFTSLHGYAEEVGKIIGALRQSIIRKGKN